jgi:hypothetical protein
MTVSAASGAIKIKVDEITERVGRQVLSRGVRALNALRNAEIETLTNPSPSSPGNPPGVRTGNLRANWSGSVEPGGAGGGFVSLTVQMTSNANYAGYLENGTSKMAARPYKKRIEDAATPPIAAIYSEPYV